MFDKHIKIHRSQALSCPKRTGFLLCLPGTSVNPIIHVLGSLVTIKLKSLLSMWWTLTCCLHRLPQPEPQRICCILSHFSSSALIFLIVLDVMGCSSDFCHIFTWFTTFRWSGRLLSASDMDVLYLTLLFCVEYQKLRSCEVLIWTVITVYKLKTSAWVLGWRSLSPSPIESQHTWWRWCSSAFFSLSLSAWISSTALDLSTCWGRISSKWVKKVATRAM